MIVQILFAHQSVAPQSQTVVAREDNQRVIEFTDFFQFIDYPPDFMIKMGNHAVIFCQMTAHFRFLPRISRQDFIADGFHTIQKRMGFAEIAGSVRVLGSYIFLYFSGIVRGSCGGQEKRLIGRLLSALFEITDRRVREQFG